MTVAVATKKSPAKKVIAKKSPAKKVISKKPATKKPHKNAINVNISTNNTLTWGDNKSIEKTLVQYIYNHGKTSKRTPTSAIVGVKIDDKIYIGWSCCLNKEDFVKAKGRALAAARCLAKAKMIKKNAIVYGEKLGISLKDTVIPHEICKTLNRFEDRCKSYFKIEDIVLVS